MCDALLAWYAQHRRSVPLIVRRSAACVSSVCDGRASKALRAGCAELLVQLGSVAVCEAWCARADACAAAATDDEAVLSLLAVLFSLCAQRARSPSNAGAGADDDALCAMLALALPRCVAEFARGEARSGPRWSAVVDVVSVAACLHRRPSVRAAVERALSKAATAVARASGGAGGPGDERLASATQLCVQRTRELWPALVAGAAADSADACAMIVRATAGAPA